MKREKRKLWLVKKSRRLQSTRKRRKHKTYLIGRGVYTPKPSKIIKKIDRSLGYTIRMPKVMSIRDNEVETLSFFESVRDLAFTKKAALIKVDHSDLQKISSEAVLLLISEFERIEYFSPQLSLMGLFNGCSQEVLKILFGAGYLDHYDKTPNLDHASVDKVNYIRHRDGVETCNKTVTEIVEEFDQSAEFSQREKKRLISSLTELMENAVRHAYTVKDREAMWLTRKWWILGSRNSQTGELYICICDQGVGLASTLAKKYRILGMQLPVSHLTIVEDVFYKERMKLLQKKETGSNNGLSRLKQFVDQASFGELFIHTRDIRVSIEAGKKDEAISVTSSKKTLEGTLIVWKVRVSNNSQHEGEN